MSITDAASAPPNLYQKPAHSSTARRGRWPPVRPVLAGSPARDLPAGTIVDLPSVRYSNGQMEMRPADRPPAVGCARSRRSRRGAAERRRLARLAACIRTQHSAESGVAAGEYRIAAGEFLKSTGYLLDLRA